MKQSYIYKIAGGDPEDFFLITSETYLGDYVEEYIRTSLDRIDLINKLEEENIDYSITYPENYSEFLE